MTTISIRGTEYETATEAAQGLAFSGDRAIGIGGKYLTVTESEYRRLERDGYRPTLWTYCDSANRIVSVPA